MILVIIGMNKECHMKIYKSTNGKCNICGPKIKELRESSKFSQEQLAAKGLFRIMNCFTLQRFLMSQ